MTTLLPLSFLPSSSFSFLFNFSSLFFLISAFSFIIFPSSSSSPYPIFFFPLLLILVPPFLHLLLPHPLYPPTPLSSRPPPPQPPTASPSSSDVITRRNVAKRPFSRLLKLLITSLFPLSINTIRNSKFVLSPALHKGRGMCSRRPAASPTAVSRFVLLRDLFSYSWLIHFLFIFPLFHLSLFRLYVFTHIFVVAVLISSVFFIHLFHLKENERSYRCKTEEKKIGEEKEDSETNPVSVLAKDRR